MPTYTAPGHPGALADAIYKVAQLLTEGFHEPDPIRVALCEEIMAALEHSETLAGEDMVFPGWSVSKKFNERPEFQRVNARRARPCSPQGPRRARAEGGGSMTPQEIFDTVAVHLIKQGRKSLDGLKCRYRAADGCRCAVGALIPDSLYHEAMEGMPVDVLAAAFHSELPGWFSDDLQLLQALQRVHDLNSTGEWRLRLAWAAEEFGLSADALEVAA